LNFTVCSEPLYFDGALVAPPPACADTSEPNDTIAIEAAIMTMFLHIGPSIGLWQQSAFPVRLVVVTEENIFSVEYDPHR
jgi:hypothetical protein